VIQGDMMLASERIYLRPMEENDADDIVRWRNAEYIIKMMFSDDRITKEGHIEWFRNIDRKKRLDYMICIKADDKSIGSINLSDIDLKNQKAELGIYIGEQEYQGQGFASEAMKLLLDHAFNKISIRRIYLKVLSFNQPAINLYKKIGFKEEGVLRQDIYKSGAFQDVIIMGILKDEWSAC
jgi:UDP-4-amino-4,6-dideoxy-N-acetyl-beta-L-altrosamine N-acetyltransferase